MCFSSFRNSSRSIHIGARFTASTKRNSVVPAVIDSPLILPSGNTMCRPSIPPRIAIRGCSANSLSASSAQSMLSNMSSSCSSATYLALAMRIARSYITFSYRSLALSMNSFAPVRCAAMRFVCSGVEPSSITIISESGHFLSRSTIWQTCRLLLCDCMTKLIRGALL